MPPTYCFLVVTGTYTMVQALIQFIWSSISLAQYYCVVDFLRGYPLLVYIRMLYYHNPNSCGAEIHIGEVVDELANQAFVYLPTVPHVTMRTFILNCISVALSVLWVVGSIVLIKGGYRRHHSNHVHWPWVVVTFLVSLLDMVQILTFSNDSFHTRTMSQLLDFINGIPSGFGNVDLDTRWASWAMVLLHSRFGVILLINIGLVVSTILDCTKYRTSVTSSEVERTTRNFEASPDTSSKVEEGSEVATSRSPIEQMPKIPRPGLSQSFRTMKNFLFGRSASLNSLNDRTRTRVNFQRNVSASDPVQAAPHSFENLIAEQQRRLRSATVDTAGRRSPTQGSRSMPQLNTSVPETSRGLRGATGQLPSQMPWAYIAGAPTNRMRDQLPPDEDLPPVPLPDYTALQSHRKASVHRAASSLSSLTQKKDYTNSKSSHQAGTKGVAGRRHIEAERSEAG